MNFERYFKLNMDEMQGWRGFALFIGSREPLNILWVE